MKRTAFLGLSLAAVACGGADSNANVPSGDAAAAKLGKVASVYEAFDHSACKDGQNCARVFAQRAGIDLGVSGKNRVPNPRKHLPNPDSTWLPSWSELPNSEAGAHYTFEALTLAAVRKSWRSGCDAAYLTYAKKLGERLDKLDRQIADLNRQPNPYDRLGGLLEIVTDKPDKSNLDELVPGSDPVRYRWEAAVFEAFEDTGRTFVYSFDAYPPSDELLAVLHPRQAKEYEREAFCMGAAAGRVSAYPAPPDTSSWDAQVRDMVREVVPSEVAKRVETRRKEMRDVSKAKFAKVKLANPQLPPGVRELTVNSIRSFSRDGRTAQVVSLTTKEEKTTLASGKLRVSKIDDNAVTTFADWPSGVVLEPGDSVSFYGAELSVRETIVKSTPELEHRSREYKIDGKHVTKLTTKGKTFKYFR